MSGAQNLGGGGLGQSESPHEEEWRQSQHGDEGSL